MKSDLENKTPDKPVDPAGSQEQFFRSSAIVAAFSVLSRVLGYGREFLLAYFVGVNATSEAINMAIKVPSFFRRVFAEGAFNVTFLPLFSESKKDMRFAGQVFTLLLGSCFLILGLFEWKFEWITSQIMNTKNQETWALFSRYGPIVFPYVFFIIIGAFYGGLLNAFGRFSALAFSYGVGNIVIISFVLIASFFSQDYGLLFCIGVLLSGMSQCFMLMVCVWRARIPIRLHWPTWTPHLKRFVKKFIPSVLSVSILQINTLAVLAFVKYMPQGSISCLSYADRLNQFPLSLIGVSISSVVLPLLAQQIHSKDTQGARRTQNQALRLALFLSFPLAHLMMAMAPLLVHLFYGQTKIDSSSLFTIAKILSLYSTGIPAYIFIKILNARFFAHSHLKIPLMGSLLNVSIDVTLSYFLIHDFGPLAIAFAVSVSSWANVLFLLWRLRKEYDWKPTGLFWTFAWRMALVCMVSACVVWGLQNQMAFLWMHQNFFLRLGVFLGILTISGVIFVLGLVFLKVATHRQRLLFKQSMRAILKFKKNKQKNGL